MFDILVYLFENYYQSDLYPDEDALARKLTAAGFEHDDISDALTWLQGLSATDASTLPASLAESTAFRGYAQAETTKLGVEGRGFLAFLEGAKVLTPLLREIIIERAMALSEDSVSIEKLKVIVLMVLWSQQHSIDSLVLEELLSDRAQLLMH
jgi:Smg protein